MLQGSFGCCPFENAALSDLPPTFVTSALVSSGVLFGMLGSAWFSFPISTSTCAVVWIAERGSVF